MEKLGFGYEDSKKSNSALIYTVYSGWGDTGPYTEQLCRPRHDGASRRRMVHFL